MAFHEITNWEHFLRHAFKKFKINYNMENKSSVTLSDFVIARTIGVGTYGRVVLARSKNKNTYHAIKIMVKMKMVKLRSVKGILNEKRIHLSIDFPFIVKSEHCFQDNSNLYIVMPFVPGGELFTHLRKLGRFSEETAKFYVAQVLLVLEYLHYLRIVFRDLKPENLLIDKDGYLKLIDLGFCKRVQSRTYSFAGTAEYMAPEVVLSKGYGLAVDWWSFGVLIYELCVGVPPFADVRQKKVFKSIVEGTYKSEHLKTPECRDLVRRLLTRDPSKRLGNAGNGALDVKRHVWFAGTSWLDVLNKKVEPPFQPQLKGPGDCSYYGSYKERPIKVASHPLYVEQFANF